MKNFIEIKNRFIPVKSENISLRNYYNFHTNNGIYWYKSDKTFQNLLNEYFYVARGKNLNYISSSENFSHYTKPIYESYTSNYQQNSVSMEYECISDERIVNQPMSLFTKNNKKLHKKYDGSLIDNGIEIILPVCHSNNDIDAVTKRLFKLPLYDDDCCGSHLHLGKRNINYFEPETTFARNIIYYLPLILFLYRDRINNTFCHYSDSFFTNLRDKYNGIHFNDSGTLEIRFVKCSDYLQTNFALKLGLYMLQYPLHSFNNLIERLENKRGLNSLIKQYCVAYENSNNRTLNNDVSYLVQEVKKYTERIKEKLLDNYLNSHYQQFI